MTGGGGDGEARYTAPSLESLRHPIHPVGVGIQRWQSIYSLARQQGTHMQQGVGANAHQH